MILSNLYRGSNSLPIKNGRSLIVRAAIFLLGRGGEIRTPDPHNPIVVRYQAALRPDRLQTKADGGNDTCHSMQKKVDFFSAAEA